MVIPAVFNQTPLNPAANPHLPYHNPIKYSTPYPQLMLTVKSQTTKEASGVGASAPSGDFNTSVIPHPPTPPTQKIAFLAKLCYNKSIKGVALGTITLLVWFKSRVSDLNFFFGYFAVLRALQ